LLPGAAPPQAMRSSGGNTAEHCGLLVAAALGAATAAAAQNSRKRIMGGATIWGAAHVFLPLNVQCDCAVEPLFMRRQKIVKKEEEEGVK